MTAVTVSAGQFGAACLLGMGLGGFYELLRPFRPRWTWLADGIFVVCALWVWVFLGFGICRGDLRISQIAGLLLGGIAFRQTLGKLIQPLLSALYRKIGGAFRFLLRPVGKLLKKIWEITKKIFASGRKSVTIKWNKRRHFRRYPGGKAYGKPIQSPQPDPAGLPP